MAAASTHIPLALGGTLNQHPGTADLLIFSLGDTPPGRFELVCLVELDI